MVFGLLVSRGLLKGVKPLLPALFKYWFNESPAPGNCRVLCCSGIKKPPKNDCLYKANALYQTLI